MGLLKNLQTIFPIDPSEQESFLQAFTHTSWANEHGGRFCANERLEFYGDAVLGYVMAEYLYYTYPDHPEGDLTRLKSELVREPVLADIARKLGVPELLRLGEGAQGEDLKERPSVQADALEAIIGWIAEHRGIPTAREWILQHWENYLRKLQPEFNSDYKGMLQTEVQRLYNQIPVYTVISSSGPDHAKRFSVQVEYAGKVQAVAEGKSKKEAEQLGAKRALDLLKR